jgi:hypothetical protein
MTHETVCAAVRALGGVIEASKALGVHPRTVKRWLTDDTRPRRWQLALLIARACRWAVVMPDGSNHGR